MIGSLLYITDSRPDIMFSIYLYAKYQSNPKESHLKAVKMILSYINNTINYDLFYPKSGTFELRSYSELSLLDVNPIGKVLVILVTFETHTSFVIQRIVKLRVITNNRSKIYCY